MQRIILNTCNSKYPVMIGSSIFCRLPELLKRYELFKNIYIIVDKNVAKFHLDLIKSVVSGHFKKMHVRILNPGEKAKSESSLKKIYSDLLNHNFGRDTTLISIGGGITGDLAGYAAATYMRGIQLVHIPTTLLAMIDSSIGGKTGINFESKKNIIGSFYQPKFVLIDVAFLSTLPKRELHSAFGELVKYGLISNKDFYNFLSVNFDNIKSLHDPTIKKVITESILIKGGIVARDEFEMLAVRKILNLGHTFAHALESSFSFKIKHGEAVLGGLICALFLSSKMGLIKSTNLKKILTLPLRLPLPKLINTFNNQQIFSTMIYDKKNESEKPMFVLISDIGNVVVDVPARKKEIFFALNNLKKSISV